MTPSEAAVAALELAAEADVFWDVADALDAEALDAVALFELDPPHAESAKQHAHISPKITSKERFLMVSPFLEQRFRAGHKPRYIQQNNSETA